MVRRRALVLGVLPLLHLALCLATARGFLGSEGGWAWFAVFFVDLPFSVLLLPIMKHVGPFLPLGLQGPPFGGSRLAYC
jgi:hypothetical protein